MTAPLLRCPPLLSCPEGGERCWRLPDGTPRCGVAVPPPDEDDGCTVYTVASKGGERR